MVWTDKEKELVAVGISVAAGCRPCTKYHFKHAREMAISDDEIRQTVTDAINLRKKEESLQRISFETLHFVIDYLKSLISR